MTDLTAINAQLVELKARKDIALIQFNKSRALLKRTSEYKTMKENESKLDNLNNQLDDLFYEQSKLESVINKQTLINLGFECRTGYKVNTKYDNEYLYKFIIIHENAPQFNSITVGENKKDCNIENLCLFHHEDTAWDFAWHKWNKMTIDEQNELLR
jgi:hypothetical protein